MSEKFTASNGIKVEVKPGGPLKIVPLDGAFYLITPSEEVALREFFLHERDEKLGRWRSPTGFYVYPMGEINGERVVQVLDELNGQSHGFSEGGEFKGLGIFYEAANDYFAAHPVRKPWHDAKPGECWRFEMKNGRVHGGVIDAERYLHSIDSEGENLYVHVDSPMIVAGRKLWPVVSGE